MSEPSEDRPRRPWGAPDEPEPEPEPESESGPPPSPSLEETGRAGGSRAVIWIALAIAIGAGLFALLRLFPGSVSTPEDWMRVAGGLAMAALVASGLAARRLNWGETLRSAAIWGAILGVLLVGVAYRTELVEVALRVRSALIPSYAMAGGPRELVLSRSEGGHYAVVAQVNGAPVTFLIDTGASDIVLSPDDATRVGLNLSSLSFDRLYGTANGVGRGAAATVETLSIGPIRLKDVQVSVNQAPMGASLLGMTFVRRLQSMRFEGDRLIMTWRP